MSIAFLVTTLVVVATLAAQTDEPVEVVYERVLTADAP